MSDIDLNNIRRLDGSLLLVFRELLLRRRATEVALRLGLSQSAVSHALTRLRDLFGDPLFIRKSHGLEPTQRALALGPRIEALIEMADNVLTVEGGFDPSLSTRQFNLAAPDYIASLIGGRLGETFRRHAPRAAFVARRLLVDVAVAAVRKGEIDIAMGMFGALPPDIEARTLYEDSYCVVARKGHPKVKGSVDLETYVEIGHVFVGHPSWSIVDEVVYDPAQVGEAYGTIPDPELVKTFAYVSQWQTAMLMVSESDILADCPRRFAERFAKRFNLQVLDPPYDAKHFTVQAIRRSDVTDLGTDWLMERIGEAV